MYRTRLSLVALVAVAVLATVLTGCGRKGLIRINGDKIAKDEFYARLEQVPVQTPQGPMPAGQYVIRQMIEEKLMEQLAKEQGVEPTQTQIDNKIKFIKRQNGGNLTAPAEEMKRQVALQQAFINVRTKGINVTDADVEKAYKQILAAKQSPFKKPAGVLVSAIIVSSQADANKAYKLLKDGQEFTTVAMQMTPKDKITVQTGGKLGWVTTDGQLEVLASGRAIPLDKGTLAQVAKLQLGSYGQPFKAGTDWLILKAEQKRPEKITSLADVKNVLKEDVAMSKSDQNKFNDAFKNFTKKADIQVNAERYKTIPETMKKQASAGVQVPATGVQPTKPAK